jgi:hypothetical protein
VPLQGTHAEPGIALRKEVDARESSLNPQGGFSRDLVGQVSLACNSLISWRVFFGFGLGQFEPRKRFTSSRRTQRQIGTGTGASMRRSARRQARTSLLLSIRYRAHHHPRQINRKKSLQVHMHFRFNSLFAHRELINDRNRKFDQ